MSKTVPSTVITMMTLVSENDLSEVVIHKEEEIQVPVYEIKFGTTVQEYNMQNKLYNESKEAA